MQCRVYVAFERPTALLIDKGEGTSILVASLLIWSITQSSTPNYGNDATC